MIWILFKRLLYFTLVILLISCKTEDKIQSINTNLLIKAGYVCGWGSGTDSLKISKTGISYSFYIPSQSAKPQIMKSRSISDAEWSEILKCVRLDEFTRLNYNTCNVCFDGCDEWISMQSDQNFHKITFNKGLKIDTIGQLQLKIASLRSEFNP
jgi:hypothetical protein